MSRRIYTIDELYSFCSQNKLYNFSADQNTDEIVVQMFAKFEKDNSEQDKLTEGLRPFKAAAFHDHVNLNRSSITEKSFKENVPSTNLRPILANVITTEDGVLDFGSHDFHEEIDEDGNSKWIYDEQPIGVIDGSKTKIEYDDSYGVNRAILSGYVYENYCQDAVDILERRGSVDCSIELSIRAMSYDATEKVLVLDDWYATGLTLLGQGVLPGMYGSHLELMDFAASNDSVVDHLSNNQVDKLIDLLDKVNNALSNFNINNEKGGTEVENENIFEEEVTTQTEEVTAVEESTEEEVTVTEDEFAETAEETPDVVIVEEAKPRDTDADDTVEESDDQEEGEPEGQSDDGDDSNAEAEDFAVDTENAAAETVVDDITFTVNYNGVSKNYSVSMKDKFNAIYSLINETYGEMDNEFYDVDVFEDNKTIEMYGIFTGKNYRQQYKVKQDNYSLVGDRVQIYAKYLTSDEITKLEALKANYSSMTDELAEAKSKLEKYEFAEACADKMTVFNDEAYAQFLDTDEFKALMSEESLRAYSKDELKDKADLAFSKLVKKSGSFALHTETKTEQPTMRLFGKVEYNANFLDKLLNKK